MSSVPKTKKIAIELPTHFILFINKIAKDWGENRCDTIRHIIRYGINKYMVDRQHKHNEGMGKNR